MTRSQAATILFTSTGVVMRYREGVVDMQLVGAKLRRASGLNPLPGRSNYLVGNDQKKWRTDIPTFGKLQYERIYPGIDLVYYGNQRRLESDFVISPGADPGRIRVAFRGQQSMRLDTDGGLILSVPGGELRQHPPLAYQETGGERRMVKCHYRLRASGEVGLELGSYDRRRPLVIDPVLAYSSYLGGSGTDIANGVAVDSGGNVYVVGNTNSTDFPTLNPTQAANAGNQDVFVTKVNATGTAIVYSTYLGGSSNDYGRGIGVDGSGNAWITGMTQSVSNFPWTPAASPWTDTGFVAKLNSSGNSLLLATPLGDYGYGIAVDGSGAAYATGSAFMNSIPVLNPVQATKNGLPDAYVVKFDSSGTVVYGTYLGGAWSEHGYAIAVDSTGSACITGETDSSDFPLANPRQATFGGGAFNAFVAKLNSSGNALVFSTYLGGNGWDTGEAVSMDASGNCYVAGRTSSSNFPVVNAVQSTRSGSRDAFVTAYSSTGSSYLYSTLLGGASDDDAKAIAATSSGAVWVTGQTQSLDFPITGDALQAAPGGGTPGVFQSVNGGANWSSLGLSKNVSALTVDPGDAQRIYAGTDSGLYTSTSGGSSWQYSGFGSVYAMALHPSNSCMWYVLTGSYLYYSANCGGTWPASVSLGTSGVSVVVSATSPTVVWLTTTGKLCRVSNLGGSPVNSSCWSNSTVAGGILAVDPASTCTVYLGNPAGSVYKKTGCSSDDWPWPDTGAAFASAVTALAVHPTDQATVLAGTADGKVYKKVGTNPWGLIGSLSGQVNSILFHPANPLVIYAATASGLVYKSSDGGASWDSPVSVSGTPRALAANAAAPSTVRVGTAAQGDAFVVSLNASGGMAYSSFLGGRSFDSGYGIALDSSGSAYVVGQTLSSDFPVTPGRFQSANGGGYDGFLAKIITGTPVAITVTTNPAGREFVVDGATFTSSQTFTWVVGSTHSIGVASPQGGGGTRYVLANWNDGGAATHNITAPASAATYTASFTTQYLLTKQVSPPGYGTVSADPAAADGYYASGASVQVTAWPNPGYVFTQWSGDRPGGGNPQWLSMSAPISVTANFGPQIPTQALRFVPITPCRVADTRNAAGPYGGPVLAAYATRDFAIPAGSCGIPGSALAYSFNVTVLPSGPLLYLSMWPTGQPQPVVSTLNALDGRWTANAAIVPAGTSGSVSVFVSDATHVVLDINGYFVPAATSGALAFYPLTPCRVMDTRGGASIGAGGTLTVPVRSSPCSVPSGAVAYSLNFTALPHGPLGWITTWPTGQAMPTASTLNAPTGTVTPNAAILPAGANGSVDVYASNATDLLVDINGYFAPSGTGGLSFYTLTPCRVADTRNPPWPFGGPALVGTRDFAVPASACGVPSGAQAYALNATVWPATGFLNWLTLWPEGGAMPVVSTLNSWDGRLVANAAIVPTTNGSISAYASDLTQFFFDINGYFAP